VDNDGIFDKIDDSINISTLSYWGVISLAMLLLIFGLIGLKQRKVILG
jgi:hypothetical protein